MTEAVCSPAFSAAPGEVIAVKGSVAISTVKPELGLGGREAVQKITVLHSSPAPDIGFHKGRNPPSPSSCVLLSSKILTQEITKGLKKTFRLSGLYLLRVNL